MDGASLFQGASDVGGLATSSTPYQRLWLLWLRFFLRFSQVLAHSLSPPVQHNKVVERGRQPWKAGVIDHCSHHKGSRQKHQEHVYHHEIAYNHNFILPCNIPSKIPKHRNLIDSHCLLLCNCPRSFLKGFKCKIPNRCRVSILRCLCKAKRCKKCIQQHGNSARWNID